MIVFQIHPVSAAHLDLPSQLAVAGYIVAAQLSDARHAAARRLGPAAAQ